MTTVVIALTAQMKRIGRARIALVPVFAVWVYPHVTGQVFFLVQLATRMIRSVICLDHSNKISPATVLALVQTNWATQTHLSARSHLIVPLADVRSVVARTYFKVWQTASMNSSSSCSRPFNVAMAAKSRFFSKMTEHVIAQIVRLNPNGSAQLVPAQSFATKTSTDSPWIGFIS